MNKTGGGFIHRKCQRVLLTCSSALALSDCRKIVYGHATSFLNRFSPLSKECNLLTTTFAIQSFNNALKRPLPFNVFIHWHMLAMRVPVSLHLTFLSFSSTAFVAYLGFINLLVAQSHPVMLLFCQLLINRDKVHQPNSESPAGAQSENRDCSKETGVASGMCFVNLVKSIKYLKHHINSRTLTR